MARTYAPPKRTGHRDHAPYVGDSLPPIEELRQRSVVTPILMLSILSSVHD